MRSLQLETGLYMLMGGQEISVHGGKHATAGSWLEGQDARYPEDTGDSTVLKNKKGMLEVSRGGSQAH